MHPRTWYLCLLPLLALAGWVLLARGQESDELSSPGELSPAAARAGPRLASAGSSAPATRAGSGARADEPVGTVRIFGEIELPKGVAAGAGLVAVLTPNGEPVRVLARQALSDGLRFDWSVPYGTERSTWPLRVVLFVPGLPRQEVRIESHREGESRITFPSPPALASLPRIAGRLTDPTGHALEGFHFVLSVDYQRASSAMDLPSGLDSLFQLSNFREPILVTTGADGQYEARTTTSLAMWPLSLNPRWIFLSGIDQAGVTPGTSAVDLTASPAARMRGHVRDAATGEPLADHQRTIYFHHGGRIVGTYGWGGSDAAFDWATAVTDWGSGPLEIEMQVTARLYEPFGIRLHPGPEGLDETLDIALRPLTPAEIGELVVLVGIDDAQGQPLQVTLAQRIERKRSTGGFELSPEPPAPGDEGPVYRLAAGKHHVSITLDGIFGTLMRWEGEASVPRGGRTSLFVPWPAYGSLRLRYGSFVAGEKRTSLDLRHLVTRARVGFERNTRAGETWIPALPAGSWVLTDHSHTPPTERNLEIAAGAETVVDIEP